jgi:hypothetical protein
VTPFLLRCPGEKVSHSAIAVVFCPCQYRASRAIGRTFFMSQELTQEQSIEQTTTDNPADGEAPETDPVII